MFSAKDLISVNNVSRTYMEGKHICFVLKNGIIVKLNPNEVNAKIKNESKGE